MTTKLKIYNGALHILGETPLANILEARKPRRLLDAAWEDGAVRYCLEQGYWNFASRTSKFTHSSAVETSFGFLRVFEKPADWITTSRLCSDEYLQEPLIHYRDEGGYWYADLDDLYVQYITDDASFGGDLTLWPETFVRFIRYYLAREICMSLTQDNSRYDKLEAELGRLRTDARSKDAMNQPTQFPPAGRWTRARNSRLGQNDRVGSRLTS